MGMHLASGIWHLAPCIQHTASFTLNPKERTWIEPPLEEGGSNRCSSYCVLFGGKSIALHLSFSPAFDHAWLVYQWSPVSHWDTKWQSYLACKHSSPEGIVYSQPLHTMVRLLMDHKAKYPIYSIERSFSSVLIYRMRPCPYARQQSAADFALITELQLQRYWHRKYKALCSMTPLTEVIAESMKRNSNCSWPFTKWRLHDTGATFILVSLHCICENRF